MSVVPSHRLRWKSATAASGDGDASWPFEPGLRDPARESDPPPGPPLSLDTAPIPALTIADELGHIAPGRSWAELCGWPPDAFAATSTILADSGAYRCVVCPPEGRSWPPLEGAFETESWESAVRRTGSEWAEWAASADQRPAGRASASPEMVAGLAALLDAAALTPVQELTEATGWGPTSAMLTLHAMADEACRGAGLDTETRFQRSAATHLAVTGSLSTLPTDRLRVLPKLRPPESGITLRSLSHHLALDRSEVQARWLLTPRSAGASRRPKVRFTLLLIPYPAAIRACDFRPVEGPLLNMDEERYGFYEYAPTEPLDPAEVVALVEAARRVVGTVDAVVLPEAAIEEAAAATLQILLSEAGVPFLIAGIRRSGDDRTPFGRNYAYIGSDAWCATPQHKHHRWCLDQGQVHQYQLGATLDPGRRWWEAIAVQARSLTFVAVPDCSCVTICPLVCEDLARPDPVTDLLRAVAPTLVVGLLLDGPQLASRWAARYASVLADDPGCSVLTLTALGMARRSQPPGFSPSRAIALWKDAVRGLQQITLAEEARAVALTAHRRGIVLSSADGRRGSRTVSQLVLTGIEQIR